MMLPTGYNKTEGKCIDGAMGMPEEKSAYWQETEWECKYGVHQPIGL